jgi:hypothetical protein
MVLFITLENSACIGEPSLVTGFRAGVEGLEQKWPEVLTQSLSSWGGKEEYCISIEPLYIMKQYQY